MTRQECESLIKEHLKEIWAIVEEYHPGVDRGLNIYIDHDSLSAFRIVEHYSLDDPEPPEYDINFYDRKEEET